MEGDMENVQVRLAEPTPEGRMYYCRDPQVENEILFFWNNIRRLKKYTIAINSVVLEIDANRILYSVEIMKARVGWKIDENVRLPEFYFPADLTFPDLEKERNFADLDVKVITDPDFHVAHVKFGEENNLTKYIKLSERCFAALNENTLIGFYVNLFDAPLMVYDKFYQKSAARNHE